MLQESKMIKKYNCELFGIDLDSNAISQAKEIAAKNGDSTQFFTLAAENIKELGISFDIIACFEVIEHLINPAPFMKSIYENLNKGGYFIFTTPNALGLEIQAIGYNKRRLQAHAIFPPMHLNAFSTHNILYFAKKHNFALSYFDTPGRLDMSALTHSIKELENENLKKITHFSDEIKAYMQYLVAYLKASSHMRVVYRKQ